MKRESFFRAIDDEIDEIKKKLGHPASEAEDRVAQACAFVEVKLPILREYESQLTSRGISVELRAAHDSLKFFMGYADGGRYGFHLTGTRDSVYHMEQLYTGRDGAVYRSLGPGIEELNEERKFDRYVQGCIREFLNASEEHGGFEAPRSAAP